MEYNLKNVLKNLNIKQIKKDLKTGGKFVLSTLGFTAMFAGASFLSGCSEDEERVVVEAEADIEATTESETIEVVENTMIEETPNIIDENQEEYDKIDGMEEDIVDFAEESLPNGFVEVNENNKLDMAEMFTDGYVMMNLSTRDNEITKSTVRVLNQKGNLSARAIIDNYQKFNYQIGDYMQIVTPDTKINFENIVIQADDAKFLNDLEEEIAQMNVATTAKERQARIDNIIAIRDSILTDYVTTSYSASTYYTAINMIIKADATAKAYGTKIFADEEARVQLYTTLEKVCDEEYAGEYKDAEYELDVETIGASQTSAESRYLNEIANFLKEAVESKPDQRYDEYYSYGQVTIRISEQIFGLYKAPAMNAVEKENSIRESASKANTPAVGTTTTQTDVPASEVPEEVREKDTTTTTDYSDNQTTDGADKIKDASESDNTYINAKGAGTSKGSADAASAYSTSYAGNAEAMPVKSVGSAPSTDSKDYNAIYTYFYNKAWNAYRADAISQEAQAKKENEQATTTFEPVDDAAEEQISEETETLETTEATTEATTEEKTTETTSSTITTTTTTTKTSTTTISSDTDTSTLSTGTYFIPVESNEEIVDEEVEDVVEDNIVGSAIRKRITALEALKRQVISMAYNINYDEETSVKRV